MQMAVDWDLLGGQMRYSASSTAIVTWEQLLEAWLTLIIGYEVLKPKRFCGS